MLNFERLVMQNAPKLDQILSDINSLKLLNQAFENYLTEKQISMFAFTYLYSRDFRTREQILYEFTSARFKVWHDYYHQEEYASVDTTFDRVKQSYLPVAWHIDEQVKRAKTKRELKMRLDGKKFGAEKGLCIPLHGVNNAYAELLVVQMRGENFLNSSENLKFELLNASYIYFHHLNRVLQQNKFNKTHNNLLSKRQYEVLELLAKNIPLQHIADALKITSYTVNFHIQNINKKIGVKNKYLAISKAKDMAFI